MDGTLNHGSLAPMPTRWTRLNWPARGRWALTVAVWTLVHWLLVSPADNFEQVSQFLPFQDKITHGVIFGVLSALVRWSIPDLWGRGWRWGVVAVVLAAYGAGTECIQLLFPHLHRTFECVDIMMDCLGIVMGMWLCGRMAAISRTGH